MWSSLPIATETNSPQARQSSTRLLATGWMLFAIAAELIGIASGQSPLTSDPSARPLPPPIPAKPSPQETATLLIHNALRQAVWGPAVVCKVRQRITLLDKQLLGTGKYAHAGQGSGQLKMHVRLAAGDQVNTLVQVSDGRVLYTTENIGNVSQRSRIDLNRVREYLGPLTSASLEDPVIAMYLAVGGQAELLRKLAQQYKWTNVQAGKLGEVEVWWLSGELAAEPPVVRALAEVDQILFLPNNSGLLPTSVRIALGKRGPLPLWLYQVEQARDKSLQNIKGDTALSMLLEFTEPTVVEQLPAELFQSQSSTETIVEETRRYLPPAPAPSTATAPAKAPLR